MIPEQSRSVEEDRPGDEARPADRPRVVGLLSDPDRPAELAESLAPERLSRRLAAEVDDHVEWQVRTRTAPVAVERRDMSAVLEEAARLRDEEGWDWAVYVTDMPIRSEYGPVVADVSMQRRVATVSLPALGAFALQRRLAGTVTQLVARLSESTDRVGINRSGRRPALVGAIRSHAVSDYDIDERLCVPPLRGRAELLVGMVRTNHPGRLILGMSTAFVATMAASAFMIFNSSTWLIATTAGPLRLGLALLFAGLLVTGWLVVRHDLWERHRPERDRELTRLYNVATLATIAQAVLAMIVATFALDLVAVTSLLSSPALSTVLSRPPTVADWFAIAALATVAGTLAGALGIGLQREQDIRNAAYGYREREHRRRAEELRDTSTERS